MPPATTAGCRRLSPSLIFPLIIYGSLVKALCIFSSTRDNLLYNCTDGKWQIRRETKWFLVWALASSFWIVLKSACSRLSWKCPTSPLNVHAAGHACNLRLLRNQLNQKRTAIPMLSYFIAIPILHLQEEVDKKGMWKVEVKDWSQKKKLKIIWQLSMPSKMTSLLKTLDAATKKYD